MNQKYIFLFALFLVSCGGGGGGSSNSGGNLSSQLTHAIQLGPIVGASVTIFRPDCKSALFQTTTDDNGAYTITPETIKSALGTQVPELLCIESTGGKDVDPNDDGVRTANEAISVNGKIRGFVKTSDLIGTSGLRVNLFGSAVADILAQTDDLSLARIEQIAQQLGVPDIDGDGKITISDVTRYEMGSKSNAEEKLRSFYLRSLHEGNNSDRQFFVESTGLSIAALRTSIQPTSNGKATLALVPFSQSSTIRYGKILSQNLDNIYSGPIIVSPGDLFFFQECGISRCYPMQAIQINNNATSSMTYSDTGGIDLSEYYGNIKTRKDITAQIDIYIRDVGAANDKIKQNSQAIGQTETLIQNLQSENSALEAELRSLGG